MAKRREYEGRVVKESFGDGSMVYGVLLEGDDEILMKCVDEKAANNLLEVYNLSVVETSVL